MIRLLMRPIKHLSYCMQNGGPTCRIEISSAETLLIRRFIGAKCTGYLPKM